MRVKTYRIFKIIVAAATLILLSALSYQCVSMYVNGSEGAFSVFTAEKVAEALRAFVPFFVFYILLVLVTVFIGVKVKDREKLPGLFSDNRLRLVKKRFSCLPDEALREEKLRRKIMFVSLVLIFICTLPCIIYMADSSHFESWELEEVISQLVLFISPWIAASFFIAVAATLLCSKSMEREIEILKKSGPVKAENSRIPERKDPKLISARFIILAASLVLIVLGIINGGADDVFIKAINICTECIGLG